MKKNKLGELLIILIVIVGSYIYTNYFPSNSKKNTTSVESTMQVDGNLKIYFIDVGQADSILIDNDGVYSLIDAGNNEDGPKLVNYFKSLGISNFKYVIGTHAHEDHIGGMDDIIRSFNIEHFYIPDVITTTKTFEDVLDALDEKNMQLETPKENDEFTINNANFKVMHVGHDKSDLNDTSIVLKMNYIDTSYLFMGDATSKVEKTLLSKDIKSDVLKVGHHGSQYSSSEEFLKKVDPKYAIIEVGKDNIYKHPKEVTLNKLKNLGTKIYRTDEDGTIILTSDGKNISFKTERTDTNG